VNVSIIPLKVSDIYGPDSDDSDSSSEDYGEGRHGDVSGDVLSEDGEPDASTSLAVRTIAKERLDSTPEGSNDLKPATRRLLSSGKEKGSSDISIPPGSTISSSRSASSSPQASPTATHQSGTETRSGSYE